MLTATMFLFVRYSVCEACVFSALEVNQLFHLISWSQTWQEGGACFWWVLRHKIGGHSLIGSSTSPLFRYKMFINFLTLVFRHEERETQFLLCWLYYLTQQLCCASRSPLLFLSRVFYYDICDCHILCVWAWTVCASALRAEQFKAQPNRMIKYN